MALGLEDFGVWLLASTAPPVLMWIAGAVRGVGHKVAPSALLICAAFGVGVTLVARAKGWV